jgi:extracellular elastinolytic metalloproteinase
MARIHRSRLLALGTACAAILAFSTTPSVGAATGKPSTENHHGSLASTPGRASFGLYDSRQNGGRATQALLASRATARTADQSKALQRLGKHLGRQAVISLDPITRTPRTVARLDGFLTKKSSKAPRAIALRYIANQRVALGMDGSAVKALHLRKQYRDIAGTTQLSFQQLRHGVPVFGSGLRVAVAKNGRVITVIGPPVASVKGGVVAPQISASSARSAALRNVKAKVAAAAASTPAGAARSTTFRGGDLAALVWFPTANGMRLGWQTLVTARGTDMYTSVVDASTGEVLYRRNLGDDLNPTSPAKALVWTNYPGAPRGGTQRVVDFGARGWLSGHGNANVKLAGPNVHVYTDINDSNAADVGEEVRSNQGRNFHYPFTMFPSTTTPCTGAFPCSWAPNTANSWRTNRQQNGAQVFFFVNNFHDHLKAAPIGFTAAAGNFEAIDPVQAEPLDGANGDVDGDGTIDGLPDGGHIDNANMDTPPDGISPRMQMYLFHQPGATYPDEDPFIASNGGDEADVVYHEYTHGLSNRLIVDANGDSTLGEVQAGAMGEAWSDWYAMDYLVGQGLFRDTAADGDLRVGQYVGAGVDIVRKQPLDCPVGSTSPKCHGTPTAGPGGFTYGDFGKVFAAGPEVHADGEIWGETLWDLRGALGKNLTEFLVTRAMSLSPSNPSMLDERDSILLADATLRGGRHLNTIWRVFAHRGMGFFAGALNGDDSTPGEDFSTPPRDNAPTGTLTGTVTDSGTGQPLAGVTITVARQGGGRLNNPSDTTGADGTYTIPNLVVGTYPKVAVASGGFDPVQVPVTIGTGTTVQDFSTRRDWAAASGGAAITAFDGPDYTPFGCGPGGAIDQSQVTGWGSDSDLVAGAAGPDTPKSITIDLPTAVDITEVSVDPSETCGDDPTAATGDYKVEVSSDGSAFTQVASGTFTPADRGRFNNVTLTGATTGITVIRFTMVAPQALQLGAGTCPGPSSGCAFMDMSEIAVHGTATP